jgi:monoamine oxidase
MLGDNMARRVIVIGAGIAGLAAAKALAERNDEVVILEARNRIGGRCHTVEGIDMGAHWIHGTEGNPLTNLARQLAVDTLFVGGDSSYTGGWESMALFTEKGSPFTPAQKLQSILLADQIWDELDHVRRKQLDQPDISLRDALARVFAQRTLSDAERALVDWHMALLARDDCAAGVENLSFLWWDEGYEVYGYGDSAFMEGYSALISALAQSLDVRLEHVVTAVSYNDATTGVEVITDRGAFQGDCVIITLPLGVLKAEKVQFNPPLPEQKRAAIQRLGMGHLGKIVVWFDEPFWSRDQYVFGYCASAVADSPTTLLNLWKTHRIPALVVMVGGARGAELEQSEETNVRDWVKTLLHTVFGEQAREPLRITRTHWAHDPYALGAYSYIAVGATPADMDALAEPVAGRLFFAGEATNSHHWAAAHGAYTSGLREAARISGDPTILPVRHFTENRRWREMMHRMLRLIDVANAVIPDDELQERVRVLSQNAVFANLAPNDLRVLAAMFEPVTFKDGEVICRAGDPATQMYAIADGTIEVQREDGYHVAFLERGSVVGEYAIFGARRRTATLISRGNSRTLMLDYPRFHRFLLAFPEANLNLLKLIIDQLLGEIQELQAERTDLRLC